MNTKSHTYKLLITEKHLDTFGHVNNATYLQIFEEARWDLITERGYGMQKIIESKLGPTILEINLKFKREIKNREQITIETTLISYEGKIGKLNQVMKNQKGEDACLMEMTFGLFDVVNRKLVLPTPEWVKAIGG